MLGQPVIIDNRPGAGGSVGVEAATKAKPDGYTLLFATAPTITVNPVLYKNLSFDTRKDLVAIHGVGGASPILIVNPNRPYQTLPALIDYAKKNPEKINYASPGSGTVSHLAGALFQQLTGTKFTHVPYKGSSPALTDVVAGVVDIMFDYAVTAGPLEAAGKVKTIATLTASRLDVLPNLPTIGELGYPDGVLNSWYGVFAPKGTPPEIIAKTEAAIAKALTDPGVVRHFNNNGEIILGDMSKAKFDTFIDAEMIKWKEIVQKSGATAN